MPTPTQTTAAGLCCACHQHQHGLAPPRRRAAPCTSRQACPACRPCPYPASAAASLRQRPAEHLIPSYWRMQRKKRAETAPRRFSASTTRAPSAPRTGGLGASARQRRRLCTPVDAGRLRALASICTLALCGRALGRGARASGRAVPNGGASGCAVPDGRAVPVCALAAAALPLPGALLPRAPALGLLGGARRRRRRAAALRRHGRGLTAGALGRRCPRARCSRQRSLPLLRRLRPPAHVAPAGTGRPHHAAARPCRRAAHRVVGIPPPLAARRARPGAGTGLLGGARRPRARSRTPPSFGGGGARQAAAALAALLQRLGVLDRKLHDRPPLLACARAQERARAAQR